MHHANCNLCGKDATSPVAEQNGYTMVRCGNCGLIYVNPRPEPWELLTLYRAYHERDGSDEGTWARLMMSNFWQIAKFLNRRFHKRGRILDVGCGYGHFLEIMKEQGWTVCGIDPSSKTLEHARKKKITVLEIPIDKVTFPDDFFDAVTAFYVLEHLPDPLAALKKIFRMLKDEGVIVLRVPHTTPVVRLLSRLRIKNDLYDLPFHLYDFSPKTITMLLEMAGFASIRIQPGKPTHPRGVMENIVSSSSTYLAQTLFTLSFGTFLLPGVSKTVIATKRKAPAPH